MIGNEGGYADFWRRAVATIIDYVIVGTLSVIFIYPRLPSEEYIIFLVGLPFMVLFLLIPYSFPFIGLIGQTPGKMLSRIKVVDDEGNKPSIRTAFMREVVGKFISFSLVTIIIFISAILFVPVLIYSILFTFNDYVNITKEVIDIHDEFSKSYVTRQHNKTSKSNGAS